MNRNTLLENEELRDCELFRIHIFCFYPIHLLKKLEFFYEFIVNLTRNQNILLSTVSIKIMNTL